MPCVKRAVLRTGEGKQVVPCVKRAVLRTGEGEKQTLKRVQGDDLVIQGDDVQGDEDEEKACDNNFKL